MQLLSGKPTEDQRQAARKEIDALLAQYQDLEAQIRRRSPRYAALTMPPTLSLGEIQQLLDDDTSLLEYALGERRSFLWVITPRALTSFVLPGRAEIDAAARRAYELLSSSQRRDRAVAAQRAAAEFSQMILGPAAGQLGNKRLLIVSDGALQYVPFAALPQPHATAGDFAGRDRALEIRPLIYDHEIVSLPSASVLAALRRDITGRRSLRERSRFSPTRSIRAMIRALPARGRRLVWMARLHPVTMRRPLKLSPGRPENPEWLTSLDCPTRAARRT